MMRHDTSSLFWLLAGEEKALADCQGIDVLRLRSWLGRAPGWQALREVVRPGLDKPGACVSIAIDPRHSRRTSTATRAAGPPAIAPSVIYLGQRCQTIRQPVGPRRHLGVDYNPLMHFRSASRTVFAVELLLAVSVSAAAQAKPPLSGVPFLRGINVSINGSAPMHFGLDTGLSVSFSVTPENASKLGLPVTAHRTIHTSGRQDVPGMKTQIVQAATITVAGHAFKSSEGVTLPDMHRDGTLGIELFRDVLLTLDYPHDRLRVADGALPLPNGHNVIAYTTGPNADDNTPTIMIRLAGQTLPAELDTGARQLNADVIVPTRIAATLPLGPTESTTSVSDVAGNRFPSRTAKLTGDMTLGDVVFHNPTVLISDWPGYIDLARVSNLLVITIDQRNHRLQISTPGTTPVTQQ